MVIGMTPAIALSDLIRDVKAGSSGFINEKRCVLGKFSWQEGFGAFSYSRADLDNVIRYVQNQEEHHRARSFREEYIDLLRRFVVEYDDRYLFHFAGD